MEKLKNKNLCILQARMGSTRLPGKVLMKAGGMALLEYQVKRLRLAKKINKIVVATSVDKKNNRIEELCKKIGVECIRGSEDDVLDRFFQCSLKYPRYDNIIRTTGDCPLIDPVIVDETIAFFEKNNYDYVSNALKPSWPDGLDTEVFKKSILVEVAEKAKLPSDREEVNEYIFRQSKYKKGNFAAPYDWSHFRLTVDEKEDFEVIKFLIKNSKITDGYLYYISVLTKYPEIMYKNMHIKRNAGLLKTLKKDKTFLKNKI